MTDKYSGDSVREAIRLFMSSRDYSVLGWCRQAGITEATLRRFLNGDSQSLRYDTFSKLASAARTTIDGILGEYKEEAEIPLAGFAGAGATLKCDEMDSDPVDWIKPSEINLPPMPAGTMLIEIHGDSMHPVAKHGDYAVINQHEVKKGINVESLLGEEVIVILDDNRSYFKLLKEGSRINQYNLHSYNNPVENLITDAKLQCCFFVHYIIKKPRNK